MSTRRGCRHVGQLQRSADPHRCQPAGNTPANAPHFLYRHVRHQASLAHSGRPRRRSCARSWRRSWPVWPASWLALSRRRPSGGFGAALLPAAADRVIPAARPGYRSDRRKPHRGSTPESQKFPRYKGDNIRTSLHNNLRSLLVLLSNCCRDFIQKRPYNMISRLLPIF